MLQLGLVPSSEAGNLVAFGAEPLRRGVAPRRGTHHILIDTPRTADKTGDVCGASSRFKALIYINLSDRHELERIAARRCIRY